MLLYIKILKVYYSSHKLKINSDKTTLVVIRHDKQQGAIIKFTIDGETVQSEKSCKILVYIFQQDGSQLGNFWKCIQACYGKLHQLQLLPKAMTIKLRSSIAAAYVSSLVQYYAHLFISLPPFYLQKLQKWRVQRFLKKHL